MGCWGVGGYCADECRRTREEGVLVLAIGRGELVTKVGEQRRVQLVPRLAREREREQERPQPSRKVFDHLLVAALEQYERRRGRIAATPPLRTALELQQSLEAHCRARAGHFE